MCVHKRESSKSLNSLHNEVNKKRAAERLKRQGGDGSVVREALAQSGLVRRHKPQDEH